MGVVKTASTMLGSWTPACNECGVALCWDISWEEYEENTEFWDDWICQDCNGGKPFQPNQKRAMPPMLIPREESTMSNMQLWNKLHKPPTTALKPIAAGRLKGKSDINPQWRMQAITEACGPCGFGWKYTIDRQWTEQGEDKEVCAFTNVSLYVKLDGVWSDAIPGTGGSMLIAKEKNGMFNSDEAFKMSTTDALSVAFKALGMAAEIYLGNFDGSKYLDRTQQQRGQQQSQQQGQQQQQSVKEPTDARIKLKEALATTFHGNLDEMADALRTYSSFDGKGKDGQPEVKFLTLANLDRPTDNEKMHKWFGSALGKLRKDQEVTDQFNQHRDERLSELKKDMGP